MTLGELALTVAVLAALGLVARRFGLSAIPAYLLAGLLLGPNEPTELYLISPSEVTDFFAELGRVTDGADDGLNDGSALSLSGVAGVVALVVHHAPDFRAELLDLHLRDVIEGLDPDDQGLILQGLAVDRVILLLAQTKKGLQ